MRIRWRGVIYAKFFSDKKNGGTEKAWEAAEAYFHELDAKLPPDSKVGKLSKRNTSGVVGVSRAEGLKRGVPYAHWQAWWTAGGKTKTACFSIRKYGEEHAKQKAIAARKHWEEEYFKEHPPTP
ncbi:MAG: AP2 domain-containing protein [Agitococcus sp.]|nr:AP2 domain-containing protein [Moraxellaceae bacterium]MBP9215615.1 AP2 domain-containing protein [Agitococcus sp.]